MHAFLFPGQGSQHLGMGQDLFDRYPKQTSTASEILGYDIRQLCLEDAQKQLGQTQFTQPALYVVNALSAMAKRDSGLEPMFVAGHSLGEYNALAYAGVFSFEDGLRLVQKRGALMSTAPAGSMAAVIGIDADTVKAALADAALDELDIANINGPKQTILSGPTEALERAQAVMESRQAMFIPLNVSGAFHSRYMAPVKAEFEAFVAGFTFSSPSLPVIANVTAQPHALPDIAQLLGQQLVEPVRWVESMDYLLDAGATDFIECGPGDVLTKLIRGIRTQPRAPKVQPASTAAPVANHTEKGPTSASATSNQQPIDPAIDVKNWNDAYPVGTLVSVAGQQSPIKTRSPATILFGHRAAVYLEGFQGYFALSDIKPV